MYSVESIRKRPGMYANATDDGTGLHNMVFEVVGNAINEALAGYCSRIGVALNADGSVPVCDDGRGLPVDFHVPSGMSTPEFVMTRLHAGGMLMGGGPEIPGTLHGVGLCVVNALS